jgi:hypothetical protein
VTLRAIESFNASIEAHAHANPDFHISDSFNGVRAVFAPRLLVTFEEQSRRYSKPAELQMNVGIAPINEPSGNSHWVHWRWSCPAFLRQTFIEWTALTTPRPGWANAY